MFKIVEKAAKAEGVTVEEAKNWMRITAHLSQVMNSLAKEKPDKIPSSPKHPKHCTQTNS